MRENIAGSPSGKAHGFDPCIVGSTPTPAANTSFFVTGSGPFGIVAQMARRGRLKIVYFDTLWVQIPPIPPKDGHSNNI